MILFIQQKLNGAGIDITRRFRRFYRRLPIFSRSFSVSAILGASSISF